MGMGWPGKFPLLPVRPWPSGESENPKHGGSSASHMTPPSFSPLLSLCCCAPPTALPSLARLLPFPPFSPRPRNPKRHQTTPFRHSRSHAFGLIVHSTTTGREETRGPRKPCANSGGRLVNQTHFPIRAWATPTPTPPPLPSGPCSSVK